MKKLNWFAALALLLLASACGDDEAFVPTVDVEVNVKATFDDELLLMRQNYRLNDSTEVNFTRVSFFVSDVVLLKSVSGEEEETGIIDLELLDFTPFTAMNPGNAANGISFVGTNVPVDDYDGIKLGLGVPADLNRTSPDKYAFGHPLSNSVHYWQGWESYMFAMIEGSIDLNHNGTFDNGESFKYHTGSDDAYENTFIYEALSLEEGNNPKFALEMDLKRLFVKPDGSRVFDPAEHLSTHNPDDFPFIAQFMLFFSQVFSF